MSCEDEREIDLLDAFFYVLQKWKLYILAGCLGLVLFGVFKYVSSEKTRAENDALIAAGREEEVIYPEAYQSALDALETQERAIRELNEKITDQRTENTNLRNDISDSKDQITTNKASIAILTDQKKELIRKQAELRSYMDQTVLLQIDATAKPLAEKQYQVVYDAAGAEALFRDPADEILSAYTQQLTLIGAGSGLSEQLGIPEKYLDELFSVRCDADSNMIFVQATGVDEPMAKAVLQAVCGLIESREPEMDSRYRPHALMPLEESYRTVVDEGLANTQSNRYSTLNSYNSQIAACDAQILNYTTTIDNLNSSIAAAQQQIEDANDAITDLQDEVRKIKRKIITDGLEEKIAAKAPSPLRSVKDGVKFGIIGAVVLAVLAAGLYFIIYLMGGKLHTASDLSYLPGLPVLAVLNRSGKQKNFIDKWIYDRRNHGLALPDPAILQTAAVSLRKLIGEDTKVAVLTSLSADVLSGITGELRALLPAVTFVPVAEAARSAAGAAELNGADAVLLYEQREESSLNDIEAELTQTALLEKRVLGVIIA